MTRHKDEALEALAHMATLLDLPEFSALDRKLALATLAHVREHVEAIQELKRVRKPHD